MSKPTDFAYYLTTYFTNHLAGRRNLSKNTIRSYSDTFCLLLVFFQEERRCPPERLAFQKIVPMAVEDFLVWLEEKRGNSISTRNQRLAAIHAFFRFLQTQKPELFLQCQQILAIPGKKEQKQTVPFILESDLQKLLSMPDRSTSYGRRDSTLLCLLYDSGARVQELIDLSARDVRLQSPATLRLLGKGRKVRVVPLMKQTAALLKDYMDEHGLDPDRTPDAPLFVNHQGKRLCRFIAIILHPQLCGDKQFFAGNAATPDSAAHISLILISSGCVKQPITSGQSVVDCVLALLRVGQLKSAKSKDRHFYAVV